jgi:dihydropteroate synthase
LVPDGKAGANASKFNLHALRVESEADARRILEELGSDTGGVAIMSRKMVHAAVAVENVQARASHIIKQVMLSKGGECATPRDVFLKDGKEPVSVIMMGTLRQLGEAARSLSVQPFGLKALSEELKAFMEGAFPREPQVRSVKAGRHTLQLGGRTLVMGIVNVTPDSFSDAGRFADFSSARLHAIEMAAAGVDIIDIGGESTRPGAEPVSLEEEAARTIPLVESVASEVDVPVSIDTYKAEIARRALDAGASIVNDISALRFDDGLAPLIAERGVPVILMHMQGMPRNMQENPVYEDVVADISRFLLERAAFALEAGIDASKIMIDPGIGFGKTVEHNLEIVRRLDEFKSLFFPLVLGTSRKRFIGSVLGCEVTERMMGTAATVAFSIARGVDVVRVHDTAEMLEVVRMADAVAGKSRTFL